MLKKLIFFFAWIGIFLMSLVALNYILLPSQLLFDNPYAEKITSFEYKIAVLVPGYAQVASRGTGGSQQIL